MDTSKRLILGRTKSEDVDEFYKIYADPKTNKFNPNGPLTDKHIASQIIQKSIEHWEKHKFGMWTIRTKENPDKIIGFGGLSYRKYEDTLKLNLGYRFNKEYWGNGYATELATYAVHHGLITLGKKEVFALVRPNHIASIKILEKSGMKLIGKLDDVPGAEKSLIYTIQQPEYNTITKS
ncbi:GNAT family N-acetyltransferase [Aquimarina sediminis]|uniref:GNAT family N-acetyltransferase n=1 Tax=Aquimarina sediminis TaxID=2070536 RepID=UPI000CA04D1E|nr:GNAT family N-acetyltransferase [Aquimarina sediminis]